MLPGCEPSYTLQFEHCTNTRKDMFLVEQGKEEHSSVSGVDQTTGTMKSLFELALSCIKRDIPLFTDHLHELPLPLLEQLLPWLSPHQLLLMEEKIGTALDTEKAWKNICEVNHYVNRYSRCNNIADQDIKNWRNFFIKMYMSSYLIPHITKIYSYEPTLQIYCSPPLSECLFPEKEKDECPALSFGAFHDHLLQMSAHAYNLSFRWRNFVLLHHHLGLINALQHSLRVLNVNCWNLKDHKCKDFLRNLAHIMSAGRLESLHLADAERLPWDMFFQIVSGCLHCETCSSKLPQTVRFPAASSNTLRQQQAMFGDDHLQTDNVQCKDGTSDYVGRTVVDKGGQDTDDCDESGEQEHVRTTDSEGLDLFDEALLCGQKGESGSISDTKNLQMCRLVETCSGFENTAFCARGLQHHMTQKEPALGYAHQQCTCRHETGIQRFKMTFFQPVKGSPFTAMAQWLPAWTTLHHLTLSVKNDADLENAKVGILDKIRTRQLKTFNLMAGPYCHYTLQLFWDVLRVLAGVGATSLNFCPAECFGFSSDVPLPAQELQSLGAFMGVCQLSLEGADFSYCQSLEGSLAEFIAKDVALTRIHLNDCIFSGAQTEQLLEAMTKKEPHITELSLNGMDLSPQIIQEYLCHIIIRNQNMTLLSVSNCRLSPNHITNHRLLDAVRSHQTLSNLNISRNLLGESLGRFIETVVYPGSLLKHLDLRKTNCSTAILEDLAESLFQRYPTANFPLLESISLDIDHSLYGTPEPAMLKWKHIASNVCWGIWENSSLDYVAQM